MDDALVHAFRPTIFAREVRFSLDDTTLEVGDGLSTRRIALGDIVALRVYRQPGGMFAPAFRRTIVTPSDGMRLLLQSTHYIRLGVTEDRAESYRRFVEALVARVASANPGVRVTAGYAWLAWIAWVSILAGALLMLGLGALALARGDFPWAGVLYVAFVAACVPLVWRAVRGNRPRSIDPRALPAGILD